MPRRRQTDDDREELHERRHRARLVPVQVLHEDADLVVVHKPAGLAVWSDPAGEPSLLRLLSEAGLYDPVRRPALPYELDDPVSGLVLAPRTAEAAGELARLAGRNGLDLRLLALVRGPVQEPAGSIALPVAPRGRGGSLLKIAESHGTPAVTDWTLQDRFVGFAMLECRTHPLVPQQVRVHLAAAAMPLAVDPAYDGADRLMLSSFKAGYRASRRRPEIPLISRVSLHASVVSLRHPRNGEHLRVEAPLPRDFRAALHQLDRFGRLPRG
jgi:23S rRNA pseudouridine1911/1915/1917 synthase